MREKSFLKKRKTTDPFVQKVRETVRRYDLIKTGDRVVAGVSGGADSVCLLMVLHTLAADMHFRLRAVHVHHGLRASADLDEMYVQKLCAALDIPLESIHVDAGAYADARGTGIEESARILRYEAFENICQQWEKCESGPACKIAVAHHMDDQAETVLFHLCRGSSVAGLRGMQPMNGRIIRPLLDVRRDEIEAWLTQRDIHWQTDETNADVQFARNRIRQQVLPLLEQINDRAVFHIARAAQDAAEAEEYLRRQTREAAGRCRIRENVLSIAALKKEDPVIRKRVLYRTLALAAGHRKDLEMTHISALMELCEGNGGASLDLPYGVKAVRSYDALSFSLAETEADDTRYPLSPDEYSADVFDFSGDMAAIPVKKYTKWLDYDKMTTFPVFRTRRSGDRIAISDQNSKSLSRCMIDRKVPVEFRERIVLPVLEPGQVLWIPGYRISAAFKVSQTTRQVLEIRWKAAEEGSALHEDHIG